MFGERSGVGHRGSRGCYGVIAVDRGRICVYDASTDSNLAEAALLVVDVKYSPDLGVPLLSKKSCCRSLLERKGQRAAFLRLFFRKGKMGCDYLFLGTVHHATRPVNPRTRQGLAAFRGYVERLVGHVASSYFFVPLKFIYVELSSTVGDLLSEHSANPVNETGYT